MVLTETVWGRMKEGGNPADCPPHPYLPPPHFVRGGRDQSACRTLPTPHIATRSEVTFLDCDLSGADFSGSNLAGCNLRGCTLIRTDLGSATNAFIDPARNRVKATRVSVETAVALAQSLGLEVPGYGAKSTERK